LQELDLGHDADGVAHLQRARPSPALREASELVALCDLGLAEFARKPGRRPGALRLDDRGRAGITADAPAEAEIELGVGDRPQDADDPRDADAGSRAERALAERSDAHAKIAAWSK
jgi:hypothetical protein